MIDCGEGAQIQMRRNCLSFNKLGHIFISHLHGDHCFGVIGLISTFGLMGRTGTLHIHAPKEFELMLKSQLNLFFNYDIGYQVEFHAVDTTCHKIVFEDHSLQVESIPLNHRMPCCGYLFREKPTLPHIRPEMLALYQIPVSQINNIKAGAGWTTPDGESIPHERLTLPADPPRAYAYCSDTIYMPELHKQLSGVNTLYHESTYGNDKVDNARKYFHSTAEQAAMVARDAHVQKLILGHYSARYEDESVLLDEARAIFPNAILSDEGSIIDV